MHFDPTFRDDRSTDELWRQAMVALPLPMPGAYGGLQIGRAAAQSLALFGRQLYLSAPVTWTLAYEGDTLWMSDTPQERLMMLQNTTGMAGHVLVAGGGLGLYAQYQWLVRELVGGLMQEYVPLLRCQRCFDDELRRGLAHALPTGWQAWSAARLHAWLTVYAAQVVTEREQ